MPQHEQIRQAVAEITGLDDLTTFDLMGALRHVNHLIGQYIEQHVKESDLSVARQRLLMRLMISERIDQKVSPSKLSEEQRVGRNTISALLNGLEDQQLIERAIDPEDRRRHYIQLTDAGREVAEVYAPRLATHADDMFAALTLEERKTLLVLLCKVRDVLSQKVDSDWNRHLKKGVDVASSK
jgi:DNA-binding MarR family transcriptional regulator